MGKYYLVVSYFDGKEFRDERIISKLGEARLDSLEQIDMLTSGKTKTGLLEEIQREYRLENQNQVAIKYYKSKDATATYYKVIFYDKDYQEAVTHLESISYMGPSYRVNTKGISKKMPIWLRERSVLEEILAKKDMALFQKKYSYQDQFSFAVRRYLSSDYDSYLDKERDYQFIFDEFSSYKVFRKWIVAQMPVYSYGSSLGKNLAPSKEKSSSMDIADKKSIEEHGKDFEIEFEKMHGYSYHTYQKRKHNLLYLDEDKEEYLDEEEVENMYGNGEKKL